MKVENKILFLLTILLIIFISTVNSTFAEEELKTKDEVAKLSLDELSRISDLIAVGRTKSLNMGVRLGKGDGVTPGFSYCTLSIEKVLKGNKDRKNVLIAMQPFFQLGKNWYKWESPYYKEGTVGIWFLSKDPKTVSTKVKKFIQEKDDYYFIYQVKRIDTELQRQIEEIIN